MLGFSVWREPGWRAWKQPGPKAQWHWGSHCLFPRGFPQKSPPGGACASRPIRLRPPGGGAALPGDRSKRRPGADAGTKDARRRSVPWVSLEPGSRAVSTSSPSTLLASQGAVNPSRTSLRLNQRSPGSPRQPVLPTDQFSKHWSD